MIIRGGSFANGEAVSNGPTGICGLMPSQTQELRELMASQPNQFRDGQ